LVLAALTLSACSDAASRETPVTEAPLAQVPPEYSGRSNPLGPEASASGAQIYAANCEMCHGPGGHGDGAAGTSMIPPPKNLAELSQTAADDYLYWRIAEGKPGTSMFAWKGILPDDDIWKLVSHIRTLK
jgi:mono/diheme cytochrome c family protein